MLVLTTMTLPPDPFVLLGLPKRPWHEADVVRGAFQSRAKFLHPDSAAGDAVKFADLNEARRLVLDPASRLLLLARTLDPAAQPGPATPADADFGFSIAAHLRIADSLVARLAAAASPLARAVRAEQKRDAIATLKTALRHTEEKLHASNSRLRELDARWPRCSAADLVALGHEFMFLEKWRRQLSDRMVALEST
jgi:curved DNA-binding protein CbpA